MGRFSQNNVVAVNGEDWQRMRKIMDPAFYKLESFVPTFNKICQDAVSIIGNDVEKSSEGVFEVQTYMQKLTLEVLGKTIFGIDFGYLGGTPSKHLQAYNSIMNELFSNVLRFLFPLYNSLPLASTKKLIQSFDTLDELIYSLIDTAKKRNAKGAESQLKEFSLLDMMVTANMETKELTDQEVRDNVFVFFLAGHETSSASLCFALYSLAKNQEIQQKLYQELITEIGKNDVEPTWESIANCNYLSMLLKETLRVYPPVPAIGGRKCAKEETFGDFTIPAETQIRVPIYALHHDEEIWGDPFVFRPERWNPEESKNIPLGAYLPFVLGPRTCIGNNFSLLEQKIFLATLLRKYKVELSSPDYTIKFKKSFLLNPEHNYKLKLVKRN